MGDIKKVEENSRTISRLTGTAFFWGSKSLARRMFMLATVGVLLSVPCLLYAPHLMENQMSENEHIFKVIHRLQAKSEYAVFLGRLDACIAERATRSKLSERCGDDATEMYIKAARDKPQNRMDEPVPRHAFLAMKNDVSQYAKDIDIGSLSENRKTDDERLVDHVLSSPVEDHLKLTQGDR